MKNLLSALLSVTLAITPMLSFAQSKVSYALPRAVVGLLEGAYGSCSGVVVAPERVLTAYHCKDAASDTFDGKKTEVLREIPDYDLLLLKVEDQTCPCVPVGIEPALDSDVIAVGNPLGIHQVVTEGAYQGKFKNPKAPEIVGSSVFSAQAEGGFSGGGIFQQQKGKWKLVGLVSAGSATVTIGPGTDRINKIF